MSTDLRAPSSRVFREPTPPSVAVTSLDLAGAIDEPVARAVEVAAMLGDTVVSVKHCSAPRGRAGIGWLLLAVGVAGLLTAAVECGLALLNAAANRAAHDAWTQLHRPDYAFRPVQLGPSVDVVALGGLALGLAGVIAGVIWLRSRRAEPYFRIGSAPGVDLALDHAPAPAFPLIAPAGDGFVLNYVDGFDGELTVDGTITRLAALAMGQARSAAGAVAIPIPPYARIRARAGQTTFAISAVAAPRPALLARRFDRRVVTYIAGSLAAHLALLGLLQLIAPEAMFGQTVGQLDEDILIRASLTTMDDPPPQTGDGGSTGSQAGDPGPGNATGMALPRGPAHDPSPGAGSDPASPAPPASHDEAIAAARHASFLDSEALIAGSSLTRMPDDLASGFSEIDGPVYAGDGTGTDGFGNRLGGRFGTCGFEPCDGGGGGQNGSGPYLTIHSGRSAGDGYFPGNGGTGFRIHSPSVPHVGTPKVVGANYDKTIIRRYIRQHIDQIGYCYDKQLLSRPTIHGEMTVRFFIAPSGAVQSAAGDGFDGEVASCVADVVAHIAFPPPGEGVEVNYPFQFHLPS